MSTVPLCYVVVHSGEKAAFEYAEEYPSRHKARIVLDESLANHRSGPHHHNEGQPDTWPEALHHDVTWNFGRNVERKEDGKAVIVLQALQMEVSLQVVQSGISNIGAVQKT